MNYTQCVFCKQPFSSLNVFTELGAKETQVSGMCDCATKPVVWTKGDMKRLYDSWWGLEHE